MLSLIIWFPLLAGLIAALVPQRFAASIAGTGAFATLALVVVVLFGFDPDGGLQYVTDVTWIPGLGVDYNLGIDGLSIFLVLLTAVAWIPGVLFSASRNSGGDKAGLYYLCLLYTSPSPRDS